MVQKEYMKNVLYVGRFELPDKNAAAHRVINNAKILRELGYNVCFCGIEKTIDLIYEEKIFGFENYPIIYNKSFFSRIKSLVSFGFIKKLIIEKKIDTIICYNPHFLTLKKLIRYCKKHSIKIIGDITEWYDNNFSLKPIKFFRFLDTQFVMRKYNKKLDGIIAISSFLEKYYSKNLDVLLLPPLIDISDDIWNQEIDYCSDSCTIVYSGDPGLTKDDLLTVIKLIDMLFTNYIFKIVGISQNQFLKLYPDQNKFLSSIKGKIVFVGRVSHKESVKFLLSSNYCFIIREPSRKNNAGFPTKFVESITSGTITICNNFSDLKQYDFIENAYIYESNEDIIETFSNIEQKEEKQLSKVFDYHNYIECVDEFLKKI